MKSAKQVREYVRRRCLEEGRNVVSFRRNWGLNWPEARARELAFIEVLNAFDCPHKTKLVMPKI